MADRTVASARASRRGDGVRRHCGDARAN